MADEVEIDIVIKDSLATFDSLENFTLKDQQRHAIKQLAKKQTCLGCATDWVR